MEDLEEEDGEENNRPPTYIFPRLQIFTHGVLYFPILSRRLRMKRKTWKRRRILKGKRRVGMRIMDHQPIFFHGCRFFLTEC